MVHIFDFYHLQRRKKVSRLRSVFSMKLTDSIDSDLSPESRPCQILAEYNGVLVNWKARNFDLLDLFLPIATGLL